MPQGSVLGSLLFLIYVKDIADNMLTFLQIIIYTIQAIFFSKRSWNTKLGLTKILKFKLKSNSLSQCTLFIRPKLESDVWGGCSVVY